MPRQRKSSIDADAVRAAANGRWSDIIAALAGIDSRLLDGNHHKCPKAGCPSTKDAFRFTDRDGDGSTVCSQCSTPGTKNGFETIQWLTGKSFPDVLADVAKYLGIEPAAARKAKKQADEEKQKLQLLEWDEGAELLAGYWGGIYKRPITLDGMKACHGKLARFHTGNRDWTVLAFPVWGERLNSAEPIAYALYNITGGTLPTFKKVGKDWIETPVKVFTMVVDRTRWDANCGDGWIGPVEKLAAATHVHKVEGPSCLLACCSLDDVPEGMVFLTNCCGAKTQPRPWMPGQVGGKLVTIGHDSDKPGQEGATGWIDRNLRWQPGWSALAEFASECRNVILHDRIEPKSGKDHRDFFLAGNGADELLDRIDAAETIAFRPGGPTLKEILVGPDESRVTSEAVESLAKSDRIYQRGGELVHVVQDSEPPRHLRRERSIATDEIVSAPRIVGLPLPGVREILTTVVTFVHETKGELSAIHPPDFVVKQVAARGQWRGIRPIEAVVESPVLRPDGSVLQVTGYDARTGLLLFPKVEFPPIPDSPTYDDAIRARDELLEIFHDFPFPSDNHKSAALAALLTPAARHAISGPVPLFAFDASTPGSGKTLAADAIAATYTGERMTRTSAPTDDGEMRKVITSIVIAAEQFALFDNIPNGERFGSASLDAALTGTSWSDRILGQSRMTGSLPLTTIFFASGNNMSWGGDTSRRVLPIRLVPAEEEPESRSGFRHPELLRWVAAERPRLAVAAVTLLRAFFVAGCPHGSLPEWGGFSEWSQIVRAAVVWCDMADPAVARQEAKSNDRKVSELRMLIEGWKEADPGRNGMTVSTALELLAKSQKQMDQIEADGGFPVDQYPILRNAIREITAAGKEPNARSIGSKLGHFRSRVSGGEYFERREERLGVAWKVVACGTSGSCGTYSLPNAGTFLDAGTCTQNGTENASRNSSPAAAGKSTATTARTATCNHLDPKTWVAQNGSMHCRGCNKFMGSRNPQEAHQ
jgi:hypothetical protein